MRALLGYLVAGGVVAGAVAQQPNVLIMIGDDLGVANIASFNPNSVGGTPPPTPNIDSLGTNGVRFVNAWSAPVCSPTRAALLTGRFGFRTGVREVGNRLATNETTMAEVLAAAGYENALFGKWHLGTRNNQGGNDAPRQSGFDAYAGILGGGVQDYFNWNKSVDGSDPFAVNVYTTTDQVNDALTWINGRNGPWSCIVAFNAPHTPFHEPDQSLHSFDLSAATNLERYKAAVEAMDTEIGRLLDGMDPNELANTYVVFVGDNGSPAQAREMPYIHNKGSVYEGGVNVPLVISGPGVVGADRDFEGLVHVTDLFATAADLAGVNFASSYPDVTIDGVSLVSVLTDATPNPVRQYNYTEVVNNGNAADGRYAVREDRYKLVYNGDNYEFYDLDSDPFETTDLLVGGLTPGQQVVYDELFEYLGSFGAAPCSADITGDDAVDLSDLAELLANFGEVTTGPVDVDNNGQVDLSDLAQLLTEFGQACL